MRFHRRIGLIVVSLIGVSTFTASAHPRRIHIHGASCQYGGPGIGATGTTSLNYTASDGATAVGNVTAVCPLDYILDDADTSTGSIYVTAWISAKTPTTASLGSTCHFSIDQPAFSDGTFAPFTVPSNQPWAYFHGQVPITGPAPNDNTGATLPAGLRVVCNLINGASITAIEVKIEPN